MGRLAGSTCYMIGAMDVAEDGGAGWRTTLAPKLRKRGVFVIDPCNKPMVGGARDEFTGRLDINQMKEEGRFDEISPKYRGEIRSNDLFYVDASTFLVCHLDNRVQTCGTWEELFWANRCKKPVIVHHEQGKKAIPNWLYLTIPHQMMFGDWDEVENYVGHVDTAEHIETYRRWKFMDWARLVRETQAAYGSF